MGCGSSKGSASNTSAAPTTGAATAAATPPAPAPGQRYAVDPEPPVALSNMTEMVAADAAAEEAAEVEDALEAVAEVEAATAIEEAETAEALAAVAAAEGEAAGGNDGVDEVFADAVRAADPETQKTMLGEALYPLVQAIDGDNCGKITGMLLELHNDELLALLRDQVQLLEKVNDAQQVIQAVRT